MAVKDRKKRRCLRCSKDFVSDHKGNRICPKCTVLNKMGSNFYLNKAFSMFTTAQTERLRTGNVKFIKEKEIGEIA